MIKLIVSQRLVARTKRYIIPRGRPLLSEIKGLCNNYLGGGGGWETRGRGIGENHNWREGRGGGVGKPEVGA